MTGIPGPREPSIGDMPRVLQAIVDELQVMWDDGILVAGHLLHAAVLMSSYVTVVLHEQCHKCRMDSPARSKVIGLLDTAGAFGCPRCKIPYEYVSRKLTNNMGEHAVWCQDMVPRFPSKTDAQQADAQVLFRSATTAAARKKVASSTGFHESAFRSLPFAPLIRNTALDVRPTIVRARRIGNALDRSRMHEVLPAVVEDTRT